VRRELRQRLADTIEAHLASPTEERVAMTYQGFEVVLPADVQMEKPYLWLRHSGKYYVELGESGQGAMVRIDNFLDKLDEHLKKLKEGLASLKLKKNSVIGELEKKEDYTSRIEALQKKIEKYDKELGVNNK
jgi:prefoldin subunit 5